MRWIVYVVSVLLLLSFVVAVQPAQQSNKIFLNPFYRASMLLNTNYTYTVVFAPADGVSKVLSAIVSFDAWITPSVTFTAWVNGQACNNPTYVISTTYASAGRGVATFDCSNVMTKAGTYVVTLRPSQANVGASTAWLDITYMNNPQGVIEVKGTEYVQGDPGTLFLLLKDANGLPIENASCYVDIYYPNIALQIHPEWVDNGVMLYKEEGLYFYDFTVPPVVGLYMVSANCRYFESNKQYYTLLDSVGPTRTVTLGTFTGDTFVLNDYSDWLYTQCDSGTGGGGSKVCDSYLEWTVLNETYNGLSVVYLGESNGAPLLTMSWWNWTSGAWVVLPNTLTFKATAAGGVPSGVDEYLSNSVPVAAINSVTKNVRVRSYVTAGSTFKLFSNWLALKATQSATVIQELKGSGEIHVTGADPTENRYIDIASCEGFADGRCAFFTNDGEFDLAEGELEEFLNISTYMTDADMDFRYYSPFSVDCTALYWVKRWNGTVWVDFTEYDVYSQPAVENCEVRLYVNATAGSEYQYWFKFDNYMKWEVDWSKFMSDAVNVTIAAVCDGLNYTFVTPITELTVLPVNDTVLMYCYQAKDDQYWINLYWDDSQGVTVAGPYASYVQEMRYYRPVLQARYEWLVHEGKVLPKLNVTGVDTSEILNNTRVIKAQTTQINVTTLQINQTVNQTKTLVDQVWTWVQSLFDWSQQDENQVVMRDVGG